MPWTDPEKYDDAILHDHYLRRWMPRLARQAVVVNKADRMAPEDMGRVCDDLRRRLREEALPEVPVLSLSAVANTEPLRRWLFEGASAKAIVIGRLRQSAVDAARELAATADVGGEVAPEPLVRSAAQAGGVAVAREAILDIIGPRGLREQSAAAMRAEAGGGPVQRARVLLQGSLGVTAKRADPKGYLLRWRERGSLDRFVAPIRQILLAAADALPARLRPSVLATADPAVIREQLTHGIDGIVSSPAVAGDRPPGRPWPAIEPLQFVAAGSLLVGITWLARHALWAAVRDIEQSSADARDADRERPRPEP